MKPDKKYILCIEKEKLLKKYIAIQSIPESYKTEWILYLLILKIVKQLIHTD